MTIEIGIVLGILVLAVVLFATERLPVDLVALLVMAALLLTGIVSVEEGVGGFSNSATVTVAAMFVLSAGLFKTGAVGFVGVRLSIIGKRSFLLALVTTMGTVGVISAFINNTAAVAIFLPIVLGVSRDMGISASKLLMPLSFASMFGGVCTLIGTSTNILVNSIAIQHGQPAFSMFEFSPLGLIFFAVGTLYMLFIGVRLIPARRVEGDLTETFRMGEYLTEIILLPEAKSVGHSVLNSPLRQDVDVDILEVIRDGKRITLPPAETILRAGDLLRVRCSVHKINQLKERVGIALKPGLKWRDRDLESPDTVLVEAVIGPNSPLSDKSLEEVKFRDTFGGTVLALRHRGETMHERLSTTRLKPGDVLLIELRRDRLARVKRDRSFVVVSEIGLPEVRRSKVVPALIIVSAVVVTATLGILPILAAAVIGCVLMVLTKCISLQEAYEAIEWKVIFMLAGILSLGIAIERTGAAFLLSSYLVKTIGSWGPFAIVAAFYLLTSLLTETMSNNATAVLLAPIGIAAAESLGISPKPLLMAVTFAASASFMTPVGYQTNTLIYGPGHYRFADFLRVGTPLNILFWVLATFLIPFFWPF